MRWLSPSAISKRRDGASLLPGGLVIGRLRGTLVAAREGYLVLDVTGVGYEVAVTPRTVGELPSVGEEVVLHTHLHLRTGWLCTGSPPRARDNCSGC